MPFYSLVLITFLTTHAFSSVEIARSMVPRGKIVETLGRDFIVKTKAGTKINIEFTRKGSFEEATGKNLNKGDELEPGEGLISLGSAAQIIQKSGHNPEGFWMLEKDQMMGWIYEINGTIVGAKNGDILSKSPVSISENTSEDTSQKHHQSP